MKSKNTTSVKSKLTLKKDVLASLDDSQMIELKGGFTSIGHQCSHMNDCSRVHGHSYVGPTYTTFCPPDHY